MIDYNDPEQRREYDRQRYQKVKDIRREQTKQRQEQQRELLRQLKMTLSCIRCGFTGHPAAIQFHHREASEKSFNIADVVSRGNHSWKRVLEEIKKCDVLCANCHAIEHDAYAKRQSVVQW